MYFCLNCITGYEEKVRKSAEKLLSDNSICEFKIWFPMKEMTERRKGIREKVLRPMFPGYLFVYWEDENEESFPFREIELLKGAVKFLRYDDRKHCLKGNDHIFVTWLHNNNGIITQSKVSLIPGQKLHIAQGPLVGFDGQIVKVDKHHKQVTVRFDVAGITNDVIFSVEFIEQNAAVNKVINLQ